MYSHNITSDAHNATVDTLSQTSNKQRKNTNVILTSDKLDKLDEPAETSNESKTNDAGYYVSDSAYMNDAKGDPASDPKTVTHTSDGKEKVTDTSNSNFEKTIE